MTYNLGVDVREIEVYLMKDPVYLNLIICLEEDPVLSNSLISELLNTFQDVEKRRMYPSAAPGQPQCQDGEFLRERHQAAGSAHLVCPEEARYGGG
jgi:hypothetical protein